MRYLRAMIMADEPEEQFYLVAHNGFYRVTDDGKTFKLKVLKNMPGHWRYEWRAFAEPDAEWLERAVQEETGQHTFLDFKDALPDQSLTWEAKRFKERFPERVPGRINIFQAANNMLDRVRITKRNPSYAVLDKNMYVYKLEKYIQENAPADQRCVVNGEIWVAREYISTLVFVGEPGKLSTIVKRSEVKPLAVA